MLLGEHFGALDGEEGRRYLQRAKEEASKTRKVIEASYRRSGDVEKSTEEMTEFFLASAPQGFLSPEVLKIVAGQMVRYIAKTMEQESEVSNQSSVIRSR